MIVYKKTHIFIYSAPLESLFPLNIVIDFVGAVRRHDTFNAFRNDLERRARVGVALPAFLYQLSNLWLAGGWDVRTKT